MPGDVKRLTQKLWQAAFESANAMHEASRIGFEIERRELNKEKTELTGEIETLDREVENLRTVVQDRERSLQESEQLVSDLRRRLAVSNGQVEKLEQQLAHFHEDRKLNQRELQRLQSHTS